MLGSQSSSRSRTAPVVRPAAAPVAAVLKGAARPVVENLEGRTLMSSDPLAHQAAVQTLPFALDFDRPVDGLHDKDGEDIGFTRVQVNRRGISGSYLPALLDLRTDLGVLNVTTSGTSTAGSNNNGDNTLTNGVETLFDATSSGFQITARLKGPLNFINLPSEQAGVMFGPDQDNYVKIVALAREEGPRLQFTDEQTYNGVYTHALNSLVNVGSFANIQTLDLRLEGDAASGKVRAYYAINGSAFVKMPAEITLSGEKRTAFFSTAAKAGLITAHKNNSGPMTVAYDRFEILPGRTLAGRPSVTRTRPTDAATDVRRDAFIAADLNLPNGGIDTATLTANTVKLYRTSDRSVVDAVVNTSGGGDTIVLQPQGLLDANTQYTFEVTDGVRDLAGAGFVSYAVTFTTGTAGGEVDPSLAFEKVQLPNTFGEQYTSVKVSPDGQKLYASTQEGEILRFPIHSDGTLGTAQVITSLQTANSGRRLVSGFAFDPGAPADQPVLWVAHSQYEIENASDWTGKISRMSGANLETVRDVVRNLPRAVRDHITSQPSFGPDGALYLPQGSNSATGAPDVPWGNRPERLLTGAILRLDVTKIPSGSVLDAKTEDGGSYNPFSSSAPLTIYASGVRNAYDLVWTKDGRLYAPTNGSAAGGATPATPALPINGSIRIDGDDDNNNANGHYSSPAVPGIGRVDQTLNDYLFLVEEDGYYGHPNPKRYEYVLNGGNPTDGTDPAEVAQYPVGTLPDRNWRGSAFDFGKNISPNGAIEYQNAAAFNGSLKGKLLVVRYSGGDDVVVLTPGSDGKIARAQTGIAGMRNFADPLDIAENTANGNLYVAEYSESDPTDRRITLLRPIPPGAKATADKKMVVFSDIASGYTGGSGAGRVQTVRITNTGTVPLSFPSDGFTILDDPDNTGNDAGLFSVVNRASLPDTIPVGESANVQVSFTATAVGLESAFLRIKSNDASGAIDVALRGVGTSGTGGTNEPSLARILRAYKIPTIVGDGANDANDGDTVYPNPPHSSSEEVLMPRLAKAGAGNVTIELLASMAKADTTNTISARVGHYTPGTRAGKTELFSVSGADAQTLNAVANGATSFDPGSAAFGLYAVFPGFVDAAKDGGLPREVFTEDSLNTWENNAANRRKVRFFPLKAADGSVVPDAYVFAFEEFDAAFDSNDVVGIIRNVRAAGAGPEIGLENKDVVPYADRLVFHRIQQLHPDMEVDENGQPFQPPDNKVHDAANLVVRNTGSDPLVIHSAVVSGLFQLTNPPAADTVIQPGASLTLNVKFVATSGNLHDGSLTITSNDADEPVTLVQLTGFWQRESEDGQEPDLPEIVQLFGYGTKITNPGELLMTPGEGGKIQRVGDEVLSPYWRRADASTPVTVRQIAAFHRQGKYAAIHWHNKGSTTASRLFTHHGDWGQSILPANDSGTAPSFGKFSPGGLFGLRVDNSEWSDPTKNPVPPGQPQDEGHHLRFWVVRDRAGKIIPNTYLLGQDYAGINYDYQDNVYLITNIAPENGPSTPTGLTATATGSVQLDWQDNTEANLAGYNVYRATAPGGPWAKINGQVATNSAFGDIFAPVGVTSYYQVKAVDLSGNESAAATASATRSGDGVAPSQPADLVAVGTETGITLDWASNTEPDLAGYHVYRSDSATGPWTKLNGAAMTASNYADTTAARNVVSHYQVVAVDGTGNASSPATASATRPAGVAPAAPAGLTASAAGEGAIELTWTAVSGAAHYNVERRGAASGGTWVEIATGVTLTGYTNVGLSPSTAYEYQVRAVGFSAGVSEPSNTATATTSAAVGYTSVNLGSATGGSTAAGAGAGDFDMVAGGGNIFGTADSFRFAYRTRTGDFDVRVRVNSLTNTDPTAKAGLMAREALTANSRNVFSYATAADTFRLGHRPNTGGSTVTARGGAVSYPNAWVRLKRVGNTFTAFNSADGNTWTQTGQVTMTLPNTVFLGMAAAPVTGSTTAEFRSLEDIVAGAPAVPQGVTAQATSSTRISVSWAAAGDAGTTYRVERRVAGSGAAFDEVTSGVIGTTFEDTGRSPGTAYEYQVRAQNAVGLSAYSAPATATTPALSNATGTFEGQDVGSTPAGGSTTVTDAIAYDVTGGGPNIGNTADGLHFVRRQLSGNFDIKVRVTEFDAADPTAKAGLMVRESLAVNSRSVFAGVSANEGYRFVSRTATGGDSRTVKTGSVSLPNAWIRLRRIGGTFTGYYSTNGTSWTQLSSASVSMPTTVYAGMAVSSNSTTDTATARFRELGDASPASQVPAAPANTRATAASAHEIDLAWDPSATAASYRIERRPVGGNWSQVAAAVTATTYHDEGRVSSRTYEYRVRAENAAGLSAFGSIASATTLPLAATFDSLNIGAATGGATTAVGATGYDVTATGATIYGTSDSFRFVHREMTGDFDVRIQVQSVSGPDGLRTGLMARATLDANSPNVFAYATKTEYRFTRRATAGGSTTFFRAGQPTYPNAWVRLKRSGDTFTGYYSTDGVKWTQTSAATQALPATVSVGMAVSSGSAGTPATVQFRNLSST